METSKEIPVLIYDDIISNSLYEIWNKVEISEQLYKTLFLFADVNELKNCTDTVDVLRQDSLATKITVELCKNDIAYTIHEWMKTNVKKISDSKSKDNFKRKVKSLLTYLQNEALVYFSKDICELVHIFHQTTLGSRQDLENCFEVGLTNVLFLRIIIPLLIEGNNQKKMIPFAKYLQLILMGCTDLDCTISNDILEESKTLKMKFYKSILDKYEELKNKKTFKGNPIVSFELWFAKNKKSGLFIIKNIKKVIDDNYDIISNQKTNNGQEYNMFEIDNLIRRLSESIKILKKQKIKSLPHLKLYKVNSASEHKSPLTLEDHSPTRINSDPILYTPKQKNKNFNGD